MGVAKFISSVVKYLELDTFEKSGKKKSIKRLLKKLNAREEQMRKALASKLEKKKKKELEEELDIIMLQIKKGEKILEKLG